MAKTPRKGSGRGGEDKNPRRKGREPRKESINQHEMLVSQIAGLVHERGVIAVELFACHNCSCAQMAVHPFSETVLCGRCKKPMASGSPRPRQKGEITSDHIEAAMRLVFEDNRGPSESPWPEGQDYTPEVKKVVDARCAAAVRAALSQIARKAAALAEEDN